MPWTPLVAQRNGRHRTARRLLYDEMRSCDKPKNKLIPSTGLVVESRITSLSNVRDHAYRSELSIVVILQVSNQSNCICIKISA